MTAEVVVTKKGQVTTPVEIRRKCGIEESFKVEIVEKDGEIVSGSGAGKGNVSEIKNMLDQMRDEDA